MNAKAKLYLSFFIVLASFLISLSLGSYGIPIADVLKLMFAPFYCVNNSNCSTEAQVLFYVRMPRVISAVIVGASLSVSGAGFQSLFRNPLVSPDILGVLAGAGFGASIAILLDFPAPLVQLASFLFGIAAVSSAYLIAWRGKGARIVDLVLSGIIVSSLFKSLISAVKFLADPEQKLPQITYWLMGGLAGSSWNGVEWLIAVSIPSILALYLIRWRLDAFMLSEEEAKSLGLRVELYKVAIIVFSTLPAAASTVVAGIVGWIGLVVPHISRMLYGESNRFSLPGSVLVGATFLLTVDTISRAVLPMELPLEVLTSFVGVPFFAYLLRKRVYRGWS